MSALGDFLDCGVCSLRRWRLDDLESFVPLADNPRIAGNLRDGFPHPYSLDDGRKWLDLATGELLDANWAVDVDGVAVGCVGFMPQSDINAGTAEIGFWLGEPYWGRGLATAAVCALTAHLLEVQSYRRLFAAVFIENAASCRVLEKAGYSREGILRRSAVKDGVVHDQALYARIAPRHEPAVAVLKGV